MRRKKALGTEGIPAVAAVDAAVVEAATPTSFAASAEEQIRVRAYFLHLARQGRPANPVEDWLNAEQELTVPRS